MGTESGIRNMTVGSPFRHILMFTLPLLAGNFLQQFYNMVDSWVVGNFVSDGALAAVGVGFPVIFLFTSLFSGIATGGTVVIAQSFGGGRPDRVRSAIDSLYTAFIRSILPITAAALAKANYISESHLCRSFKSAVGMPLTQYVNRLRMEKAAVLLRNTDEDISAVARSVGIEDLGYFDRLFRRAAGMSPGAYRRAAGKAE